VGAYRRAAPVDKRGESRGRGPGVERRVSGTRGEAAKVEDKRMSGAYRKELSMSRTGGGAAHNTHTTDRRACTHTHTPGMCSMFGDVDVGLL